MSKPLALFVGDLHLSGRRPGSRSDDWEEAQVRMLEKINQTIKKKLQEHNLTRIFITGMGSDLLYQYLYEKNESGDIIQVSDILKTAEINPSYSLAFLYATKKDDE